MSRHRNLVVVTNSELSTVRTCRKKWWFKYHEMLTAPVRIGALSTGSAMHAGLAELYLAVMRQQKSGGAFDLEGTIQDGRTATLAKLKEQIEGAMRRDGFDFDAAQKSVEQATHCVDLYARRFLAADAEQYEVIAVETPFRVYVPGTRTLFFAGVMDLVLRDRRYGDIVLGEHKSTSGHAHEAERKLDLDPQTTGYVWALDQMCRVGMFGDGDRTLRAGRVLYNVVRKKAPGAPKVNQDGAVSVAGIDTTREVYQAALDAQERVGRIAITDKQRLLLATLPDNEDRYAKRIEAFHSPEQREEWLLELRHDAKIIRSTSRGEIIATRNPEACNAPWSPPCAYRQVCVEDTQGRRDAFLIKDERRHPEVEDAVAEQEQQA